MLSSRLPILLLFVTINISCYSQDYYTPKSKIIDSIPLKAAKEPFWSWDRVYYGGGLGLQFGTLTMINISPDIGYKITQRYSAGIGLRYIYFADRRYIPAVTSSIYGASVFNRFLITSFLFAHAEYEVLNGAWDYSTSRRFFIANVWVGGGIRQSVGGAGLNLMILWNINKSPYSPFPSPQIRGGISIGI